MPTKDGSHRRLEEEIAANSLSIYRVDFFQDGPERGGNVAELLKGKAIPGDVQV